MTERSSYPPAAVPQGGPPEPWYQPDGEWGATPAEPEVNVLEYLRLLWSQKWVILGVLLVTLVLAAAWAFTREKHYTASTRLAFQSAPQPGSDSFLAFWTPPWEMDRYIQDQIQVLHTSRLVKRVRQRLGLDSSDPSSDGEAARSRGIGGLHVEPIEDSNVIVVSLTGNDPRKVAEWLNVYIDEYIELNIEDTLQRTQKVFEVIQSKLEPLRTQVELSETELVEFKQREDAVLFADEDKNVISEQIDTLTSEYATAKAERIRLETKIAALRNLTRGDRLEQSFPEVLEDPTIQSLRQQRNDLNVELTEKLQTYKEGHPVIKDLRSRLAGINERISEQVQTIRGSLQTDYEIKRRREQSLYDNLQELREQSIELTKQKMELDSLERQYEQNKAFYERMMAQSKEVDISATAGMNNVRVIDPARAPGGPSSPNIQRTLLLGGVLGLFLGIGLVLVLDFVDQTFRTPDDVERYLALETLTVVQQFKDEATHAIREAYQSLRTGVMLAARGEGGHALMVTSAGPGEGKTTVAFNLAKVLAASGDRVLLIDGDLRKPRFHRLLETKNVRGLTSVVLGERRMEEVIHTLEDVPKLDIITSGPLPPNPPELYGKGTYRRLLDLARREYQWVIVDSPPVASVTDGVVCAQTVDMVLLVIEYGGMTRKIIQETVRQINRTGARIIGSVLNKVKIGRDSYYYSYYYSYYRYGYGREQDEKRAALKPGKVRRRT